MKKNITLCLLSSLLLASCFNKNKYSENNGELIGRRPSHPAAKPKMVRSDKAMSAKDINLNSRVNVTEETPYYFPEYQKGETYKEIKENGFVEVVNQPVSTFSADVDRASYTNVRRIIGYGQFPQKDAVRIEEMINYFDYNYPQPTAEAKSPLRVSSELAPAPWNDKNLLLRIGLQAKKLDLSQAPPSNIVFLIDVSGSMSDPNKLPLLKSSFKLLLGQLKPTDKVAIVTYASGTKVALPSTAVKNREKIVKVLDELVAYLSRGTLCCYP